MEHMTDKEFDLIKNYIKHKYGISLAKDKKSLVYSRLKGIIDKLGFNDFTEYYKYLINDKTGEATRIFIDKMTTNHTFFMRETDHFDFFTQNVLPNIEKNNRGKDVRVWCAGCSSGEESYTLGMLIDKYFKGKVGWNTELLATDISTTILQKATKGVYTKDQIKLMPDDFKNEYFDDMGEKYVKITDKIKKNIIYRKFNLMEQRFPFKKKMQVIFCRNVMIYFNDETREELIKKFYDISEKGAYLFIGHSETLNNINTKYEYVMPAIYVKR